MKLSLNAASLSTLALVLVSSVASAQEVVTPGPVIVQQPAPPPPTTVVAAPPPQPVAEKTTSQATGPSMAMVGSGLVIFGLSYLPAVIAGATSGLDADHTLLVPVAGPWMDLAQRPGCSGSGSACNGETTSKVLLVTDGVFQAIGVLVTVGGFLSTAHETTTVQSTKTEPTLHVTPAALGSGYGMAAVGTF